MMTGTNQRLREILCCFTETEWGGIDVMNYSFGELPYNKYMASGQRVLLGKLNGQFVHSLKPVLKYSS